MRSVVGRLHRLFRAGRIGPDGSVPAVTATPEPTATPPARSLPWERIALLLLSLYGLLALGYALGGSGFLEGALALSLLLAGGLRIIHRVQRRERSRTRTARRLARRRAYQNYQTLSWH
jgi:hypothetical protein